jgi:hypothetical protein
MPANYCLRAIPLEAGHHLLRVEYSPLGFRIGKAVSIVAVAVFLALCALARTFHTSGFGAPIFNRLSTSSRP